MEELKKATQKKDTVDSKKRNFHDSLIDDDETCENIFEERGPNLFFDSRVSAKPTKEFKEYVPNLKFGSKTFRNPTETFEPKVGCESNEPNLSYDPFEDD